MAQILVRDLDKEVLETLKERARRDGRSLQSGVKSILEQAVRDHEKNQHNICQKLKGFLYLN